MINVGLATGQDLDAAGVALRKPRRDGESDNSYRDRLLDETPLDGGAAFGEFKQAGDCSIKSGGISVRDYFAAKVMASLISNPEAMEVASQGCEDGAGMVALFAERSYAMADAMLAERAK